jgi:hypothetical protein
MGRGLKPGQAGPGVQRPPAPPRAKPSQRSGKRLLSVPDTTPGQTHGRHVTSPDIGRYQPHHRLLTGRIAVPLAAGLVLLAAGIYLMVISWPLPSGLDFKGALFPILIGSALAVPYVFYVILLAGRVAFRADQAGITFPPMPYATLLLWTFKCHCKSEFIPWSKVKGITLYTIRGKGRARLKAPVIEIHHSYSRDAHDSYALRSIITWRLDRNRLAAIVTAAAPGIPIVERERI